MRIVTITPDDDRRAEAQRLLDAHGDGALDVIIGDMKACLALGDTDKVIRGFALLQQCEEIRTGMPYRAEDEGLTEHYG